MNISSVDCVPDDDFIVDFSSADREFNSFSEKQRKDRQSRPTLETLFKVDATKRRRRVNINQKDVQMLPANGTAASIIDWGKKYKLDLKQRHAFYAMMSSFVLTCVHEAVDDHLEKKFSGFAPSSDTINEHVELSQKLNGQKELCFFYLVLAELENRTSSTTS